jgi:short-subunit dehydrogenase
METSQRALGLVTGASSGIGLELARALAEREHDVIVTAEDAAVEDPGLLGGPRPVLAVRADLRRPEGVEEVARQAQGLGRPLDVVALNAGVAQGGPFPDDALEAHLALVDLNCRSTVHLAGLLLPGMIERGAGRLLFTASIAAEMPGPYQASYHASKAFVHLFAEGLRVELAEHGVSVTSLMPGPTETDIFRRGDLEDTKIGQGPKDDPREVAEQGLDALFAGKSSVVTGSLKNRIQADLGAHVPDAVGASVAAKQNEPGSGL